MVSPADQPGPLFILALAAASTIVPPAGRRVVITKIAAAATATGPLAWTDGTTAISITLAIGTPLVMPFDGSGWYQGANGATITFSGAAAATGIVEYYLG
jgi:hypothetical protein